MEGGILFRKNREFYADEPNPKWLTDVTEFTYYIGSKKYKVYLNAIANNPDAHPLQSCAVPSTVPTVMPGTTVADFIWQMIFQSLFLET